MATRYSGNATVHTQWSAELQGYKTSVSVEGKQVWHDLLGGPFYVSKAADSPEVYDDVAKSVLNFLDAQAEEGRFDPTIVRPAYDLNGHVEVARTKQQNSIDQHKEDHADDEKRNAQGN